MAHLMTVSVKRTPYGSRWRRLGQAIRSYWTGAFNLKDPALNKFFGIGTKSIAGPMVTEHTMFTCAAVYDAINQISSDTAKLPLNLHKRRPDGGSDHFVESKSYKLMKYRPNPETQSMQFRRQFMVHALVSHGGYAEIVRDALNRPSALWNLEPSRVQPFYDDKPSTDGRRAPLRYRVDGEQIFDSRDMLHIHGIGWDGVTGFEMVQVAREAIGLALASQQFAAAFFGNGTRFGGVLSSDQDLDEGQKKAIREQIEALHAKADKAFRLLVLGAGFKFDPSGVKPNEAQMKEIRDQQVAEVARFYNMPLHKLKLNTPGAVSYASVEMADLDYYKGTLLNWLTPLEEEYTAKLVSPLEIGIQYFKHNANAFLRGDITSRYTALGIARDKGIINADEWREFEDWNPQPDGQGKIYLVQSAQIPVNKLAELVDAQIAETKQKAKPPEPSPTGEQVASANQRAEKAEQLATEARQAEQATREKLAAAEATGTATFNELTELRETIRSQQAHADTLLLLSGQLREQSEQLSEQVALAHTAKDLADANAANILAEKLAVDGWLAAATSEVASVKESLRQAQEAEARAIEDKSLECAEYEQKLLEHVGAVDDLLEQLAKAERNRADALASVEEQARLAEAMQEVSTRLEQERDTVKGEAEQTRTQLEQQIALLNTTLTETQTAQAEQLALLQQALTRMEQDRAAEQADRDVLAAKAAAAEAAAREASEQAESIAAELSRAAAEAEQRAAEARAAQAEAERQASLSAADRQEFEARAVAAEAAKEAARQAEIQRATTAFAAHRALMVDAIGRMVRREVQQAKSKTTPDKLRRWLANFPDLHQGICREALTPVIAAILKSRQAVDDPAVVTETFIREHLETFTGQIRKALDANSEDFQAVLDHVLTRWEQERPGAVADAFMLEELRYVRSL